MKDPAAYLQPDETPLVRETRHPLSLLDAAIGSTVVALVVAAVVWFLFFRRITDPDLQVLGWPLLFLVAVVWLGSLVAVWFRIRTSSYIVTDTRVYRSFGRFRFDLLQTTYDKVTDLHVRQSFFGRLWGFGDVTMQTAGTGLVMAGVRDPFGMKQRVESARSQFLDKLLGEHRRAARPLPAPDPDATEWTPVAEGAEGAEGPTLTDATALWFGRPVALSLVGAALNLVIMGTVGVVLFLTWLPTGQGIFGLFGPALMIMAVLGFAGNYIQYRFTRYEVTPAGVVVTSGWLTRRRVETTYDKVTDVATYQGFFGRIFDFGNITVNTAGSERAPVVFRALARPDYVKGLIDEARRRRESGRRA